MTAVRVVVNMRARAGHEADFEQAWLDVCAACRAERGNRQYELFRSAADPRRFALLELWADQDAYDEHWAHEIARDNPALAYLEMGERTADVEGVEFYFDHQFWEQSNGTWVPVTDADPSADRDAG